MTFPILIDFAYKKMSVNDICLLAKSYGINHLDMMSMEIKIYGVDNVKRSLKENNIELNCLISCIPFISGTHDEILSLIDETISLAKEFSCSTVMIVPLASRMMGNGVDPISLIEGYSKEEQMDKLIKYFKITVELASKKDIAICVEDTPTCKIALSGIEDCKKLLESVPGLGLVFDTANMIPAGDDPIEFYQEFKQYIHKVHLKDVKYVENSIDECADGRFIAGCPWGEGIIPVNEIMKLLNSDGFISPATIEYCSNGTKTFDEHSEQLKKFMEYI